MPSLVEKMQPWSLRRSWSNSSGSASTTALTTACSTTSLLSGGSCSGDSVLMMGGVNSHTGKKSGGLSPSTSPPLPARAGTKNFFGKICSGGGGNSNSIANNENNSANNNCSRPKRKTPIIISESMSNWVKFDHECSKPKPCHDCDKEKNRKVLFTSGGNVISKTKNHRHSHHFFTNSSNTQNNENLPNRDRQRHSTSFSEPTSPVDSGHASSGPSSIDSNHSEFNGEIVRWGEGEEKSSFKIVINVPFIDMNVFQNDNVRVEIVCNENKVGSGKDFEIVNRARTELKNSGWYWKNIDSETSMEVLESAQPGAFIIRDSADPRFLYSLSVQTERGPTSVRLTYRNGKFSLDADEKLAELLPKFDSVIRLIEHYVSGGTKVGKQVWVDPKGNMHSTVKLTKPMRKDVGSLKHLARVAINKYGILENNIPSSSSNNTPACSSTGKVNVGAADVVPSLPTSSLSSPMADLSKLPMSLRNYISDYPYNL